jgi:hypothetical protein
MRNTWWPQETMTRGKFSSILVALWFELSLTLASALPLKPCIKNLARFKVPYVYLCVCVCVCVCVFVCVSVLYLCLSLGMKVGFRQRVCAEYIVNVTHNKELTCVHFRRHLFRQFQMQIQQHLVR